MLFFRRAFSSKKTYDIVFPGNVSPQKLFPDLPTNISIPPYAKSGIPEAENSKTPEVKNRIDIAKMRKSCNLAANILAKAGELVKPGISTQQIDDFVFEMATQNGAYPSPLNYKGFPKSVCTSVNNVACHGIPDDRELLEGDIINIDITVYLVSISRIAGFLAKCHGLN